MFKLSLLTLILSLLGCGKSGSDPAPAPAEPFESLTLNWTGAVSDLGLNSAEPPISCSVAMPLGDEADGVCITPLEVDGWVVSSRLLAENGTPFENGVSFRLHGSSALLNRDGSWEGQAFDFAGLTQISGASELENNYETQLNFDRISFDMNFIRMKFFLNDKYWTVLIPFYSQPVESNPIVQSCQYTEAELQQIASQANILGSLEFDRGDYLYCLSGSSGDCALSDFQFFDLDSSTFSTTRPSSPKQSIMVRDMDTKCSPALEETGRPKLTWGTYPFVTRMSTGVPFSLYADYAYGEDSRLNPGGEADTDDSGAAIPPYKRYYYTISGIQQVGNNANFSVTFNTRNLIFAKDIADVATLSSSSDEDIAAALTFQNLHQSEEDPSATNITEAMVSEFDFTLEQRPASTLEQN